MYVSGITLIKLDRYKSVNNTHISCNISVGGIYLTRESLIKLEY